MKAIGTQMHEAGGSLLPPIAPKSEQGIGESFQAALAQAMLGAPAAPQTPVVTPLAAMNPAKAGVTLPIEGQTSADGGDFAPAMPVIKPIFEPRPIGVTLPKVVQPPVPMPIPVAITTPVAISSPAVPTPGPTLDPAPAPAAPAAMTPEAPTPTLESRPTTPLTPVAVCAAPAEPKKKSRSDGESAEPMPAPASNDTNAAPVPLPVMERLTPAPSMPLNVPADATPQRVPREGGGSSKTTIDPKSRETTQAPRAGGFQPHALDALLPQEHASSQPAAQRATVADPKPEHDAPASEPMPMPASVKVEELHIESSVAHQPVPKSATMTAAEPKKRDAEPGIAAAGSSGAGTGGNVSSHSQRLGYEAPVSTDGPVETRHAEEPSRPPAPTDRVTLHLPDDAGGGRIQIAVRGDVVHARIVSADEAGTRELQAGADELRSALTRQGFQETHVKIEGGRVAADGWQRGAGAGAGMGAAAAGESGGSGEGRMQDSQQQDRRERHHGAPEDPRSDPRRQHSDGRPQQRARRERER